MESMRSLGYFIKEAFVNFKRNFSTGIGSIITIFLSLFLIGLFFFVSIIANSIVTSVEDSVTITAYVSDEASDEDIQTVMQYISSLDYVESVGFTTKEQALENFSESSSTNADMVVLMGDDNPLPRSIEVELSDPQQVEIVAEQIRTNETFIEICFNSNPDRYVLYGQESVERLFSVTNIVRYAGIAAVILLVFVTLIFINNTIRLAIMARRREISIMRLVGATKGFIRGPFVMEGVLHAIIGAALAISVLWVMQMFFAPYLTGVISWLPVEITTIEFLMVSLILVIIGLLIGLFGSALAMRRYLKV